MAMAIAMAMAVARCTAITLEPIRETKKPGLTAGLSASSLRMLQAKCAKALLASAMRCVFSRFWMVVPVLL